MKSQPNLKVTCIVRADSPASAFKRIKFSLEEAGYWNESYTHNIIALPGDLTQEFMGLTKDGFEKLSESVHAVFHFAASTSLVDPYSLIRHDNTLVMNSLMVLCASGGFTKPFHHVSTLAIFPEYISGFPAQYPINFNFSINISFTIFSVWDGKFLQESDHPDLAKLEELIPPNALGYPWSKWACEQVAIKCCQLAKIPLSVSL